MTTLLVIDDDADVRTALQDVLEEDAFHVVSTDNAKTALNMLEKGFRPDAILLDMMMPEMNGREFLQAKSKVEGAESIPVVIISCANAHFARSAAAEAPDGVVLLLQKPFSAESLLRVLTHVRLSTRPPPHTSSVSSIPPNPKVPTIEAESEEVESKRE